MLFVTCTACETRQVRYVANCDRCLAVLPTEGCESFVCYSAPCYLA
jgi:hypothetical protein